MKYLKFLFFTFAITILASCSKFNCKPTSGSALQGTDTVIVGLYIDKNGYPQASFDTVTVYPGQKIIFAGPEQFDILFKEQKSPNGRLEHRSSNGIVIIDIPKDIFERERKNTTSEIKQLIYKYGIRVNGKLTDPGIIVERR